ncbi:MAG: hypothetical protein AB7E10_10795, partial [Burkholderiaceae bacterium]
MVIVGGLGSVIGSFFGTAFILLMPGFMNSLINGAAKFAGVSLNVKDSTHKAHAPLARGWPQPVERQ